MSSFLILRLAGRLVGMVVVALAVIRLSQYVLDAVPIRPPQEQEWLIIIGLAGSALGFLITPLVAVRLYVWVRDQIRRAPASAVLAGTIGLTIGLSISVLLAFPLSMLPGELGNWLPLVMACVLGYVGVSIMVLRQQDMLQAFNSFLPFNTAVVAQGASAVPNQLVLDTSTVIDGRIADISQTGFIQGTLVFPHFVLDELRHIADSSDPLRRNRGRRGLEILNRLQKDASIPVIVSDVDFDDMVEVDAKLIRLAKTLHAPIITNDFNLNRVAEVQGVRALNINELTNAVKSVVLPGEELEVRVIQEGKEIGQGVGFLEDGTMVVVENGRRLMGQETGVVATRVLQTVAGRMIFAQFRGE